MDVGDVPDLIARLVDAASGRSSLFQPIVHQILLTGGVIDDEDQQPGISAVVRKLVRDGVLWRWTVQQKEERQSRRYGLTEHYAAVRRRMISGFAPDNGLGWLSPEPEMPGDHYEETALLMDGRQWVEKPLQ